MILNRTTMAQFTRNAFSNLDAPFAKKYIPPTPDIDADMYLVAPPPPPTFPHSPFHNNPYIDAMIYTRPSSPNPPPSSLFGWLLFLLYFTQKRQQQQGRRQQRRRRYLQQKQQQSVRQHWEKMQRRCWKQYW